MSDDEAEELSKLAKQACQNIEQRTDDCDMPMHGIILHALKQVAGQPCTCELCQEQELP